MTIHSRYISLHLRWQRREHDRHCDPPREPAKSEFATRFCNVCPIWRWPDIGGSALGAFPRGDTWSSCFEPWKVFGQRHVLRGGPRGRCGDHHRRAAGRLSSPWPWSRARSIGHRERVLRGAVRDGRPARMCRVADRKAGSGFGSGYTGRSREGYANDLRGVYWSLTCRPAPSTQRHLLHSELLKSRGVVPSLPACFILPFFSDASRRAHSLRRMAQGVRRLAWRSSAVYAGTHGSSAMLPYGTSTPYHHAGVNRFKRERVAVAKLEYSAL